MKSNYKQLYQYIESFDFRNKNSSEPLGLDAIKGISSIYKSFIKTKANLVGVSTGNYKVVKPNQFGFNPNTARMGDKIPIALNDGENDILVSSIYPTFKIIDENKLLPEYLLMWFKRPEFDRYARFKSHGSAREIFDFDEMRGVELPVPSIEKQREIVKEYNTIVNRIKLNEQLNQKLKETAQTLYKRWFVDFEFPNENGQPYKSAGGKMEYCEVLEIDIPIGWSHGTLEDFYKFQYGLGNTNPDNQGPYPIYGAGGVIGGYDKFNNEDAPVIGHMGAYCGAVTFAFGKHFVTYNGVMCQVKSENLKWFSYATLLTKDLMSQTRGSSQPFVSYDMLYECKAIIPDKEIAVKYDKIAVNLFNQIKLRFIEKQRLLEIESLLLSKLAALKT